MVHDDIYHVKYRQLDHLHEPVLSESLKQIGVILALFKVISLLTLDHI